MEGVGGDIPPYQNWPCSSTRRQLSISSAFMSFPIRSVQNQVCYLQTEKSGGGRGREAHLHSKVKKNVGGWGGELVLNLGSDYALISWTNSYSEPQNHRPNTTSRNHFVNPNFKATGVPGINPTALLSKPISPNFVSYPLKQCVSKQGPS